MSRINIVDLFSGAGGLSYGFHRASPRFKTVHSVEMDRAAAASFGCNFRESEVSNTTIQEWLSRCEVEGIRADVIVGGPPCQGFSQLGKREVSDSRNELWRQYVETILRVRPKYFLMENVAVFLKSPQFRELQELVHRGGLSDWSMDFRILNSADYGAPQKRRRAFVMGWLKDLPAPGWPEPSHGPDTYRTVRQAFEGEGGVGAPIPANVSEGLPEKRDQASSLPGPFLTSELHFKRNYLPISMQRFRAIPAGGSRRDLPKELMAPCWVDHSSGSGDVMGRLWWDRPSVTIRTEFFKPEKGRYIHPQEDRAISHWEAARLQGFPDGYKWVGSRTEIARQIGNAVPVQVGEALGRHLLGSFPE